MRNAKQSDIDYFYESTQNDPAIYPYIGISKFMPRWQEQKDNNAAIILTDNRVSYLLNITFSWHRVLEFEVALFSKSSIAGGRGLLALKEQIARYQPYAVNTSVQKSNLKSLEINKKLFGEPWGCEVKSAWNPLIGYYEDVFYFRKLYYLPYKSPL